MYDAIIGIDPSLTSTGLAAIVSGHCRTATVTSKPPKTERKDDWNLRDDRLEYLVSEIADWATAHGDQILAVIETPAYSKIAGHSHDRSGLWWRLFHELRARGAVMYPLTPQHRMKYATGKGNAQKDLVLAAAIRRYPWVDITGNDVADAVLLADIGARLNGTPLLPETPPKACWPLTKMPPLPWREVNPFDKGGLTGTRSRVTNDTGSGVPVFTRRSK